MARLPVPGSDDGAWGQLLNDYLSVEHDTAGVLKASGSLQNYQLSSQKGIADGYAPLDSSSKVPTANLPVATFGSPSDPALFGLALWTVPMFTAALSYGPSAQTFLTVLCRATADITITKLGTWIVTAGATAGVGVNGMALYSESGTRLAVTGDMTAQFLTSGYVEGTLTSSYALTAGTNYYIAYLCNMSTAPIIATPGSTGTFPAIRGHYPSAILFSQTSFPASFTPSSATPGNLSLFMTAGS